MTDDLYFLPLLAEALEQKNSKAALREAFIKIQEMGEKSPYKQGFLQFKRFIASVRDFSEKPFSLPEDIPPELIRDLLLPLATGLFEGDQKEDQALRDLINSRPAWKEEFENLQAEASKSEATHESLKIILMRDDEIICSVSIESPRTTKMIKNVKPGHYELKLDTGRVIWEGRLSEEDLLWTYAFPHEDLALAADTGDAVLRMSREIKLLNGEVILRVYPEIESGRIEMEVRDYQTWPQQ